MPQGFYQMNNNQVYRYALSEQPSPSPSVQWFPILLLNCGMGTSWRRKGTLLLWDRKTSLSATCSLCGWSQVCFLSQSQVATSGTAAKSWGLSLYWILYSVRSEWSLSCTLTPTSHAGKWFSLCLVHIQLKYGRMYLLEEGKNVYMLISNASFCVFILVTGTTSHIWTGAQL